MIKHIPAAILFISSMLCFGYTPAQTPVELHITHKLGGADFGLKQTAQNNLGHNFYVDRLEYYISGISIKHDGGAVTEVPAHYILADASANVVSALGSYNITNIESVSFHIGVDTPINHADPAQHPAGHPLALKSPPMHWGWASGYRFIAIEGMCGTNMDKVYSIHALEDNLYMEATVPVTGKLRSGKLIIALEAEYTNALKDMDLSSGQAAHGNGVIETKLVENFRNNVFSEGHPVSVNNAIALAGNIKVYPNPSVNGSCYVSFTDAAQEASVIVTNTTGQVIAQQQKAIGNNTVQLQLQQPGLYFVSVQYADGSRAATKFTVY